MLISLGPFITCFLGIVFLSGYLHVILHRLKYPFIYGTKVIFAGIAVIFLRICIPVNFPFTYTIYSTKLLLPLAEIIYAPIGLSDYNVFNIIILCWLIVAVLQLCRLCIRTVRLNNYLNAYTIIEEQQYSKLFASVKKYCQKPIRIAVIPHNVSPAVCGILRPTIIFPEYFDLFSTEELDYICMHEINHYKNHDLWMKMLLEIISCVHWWNPFVYFMKKEYDLTLELTNDYFLMQNHPAYNGTHYADLILKVSELTEKSLPKHSYGFTSFIRKRNSDLHIRIDFALKNSPGKFIRKNQLIVHSVIVFAVMIFSLLFVTDFTSWTPSLVIDDSYEMDPSDTYFIHTSEGYEVYLNGEYIFTTTELPEDFKDHKIYEQGEPVK